MQNTFIYTPKDKASNSYLATIFFQPLLKNKVASPLEGKIEDVRNSTIISDGEHLTVERILSLKNNGNKIISFDINDHSSLTYTYCGSEVIEMLDLIFKVSGVQTQQYVDDINIKSDMTYSKRPVSFMDDRNWNVYDKMREEGRILSLPYLPWNHFQDREYPAWEARNKRCTIRGGNHFLRYHLFLSLLKAGVASDDSAFFAKMYSTNFCDKCKAILNEKKGMPYARYKAESFHCNNSEIKWQADNAISDDFYNINHAHWNNKCLPMFYWLTEKFQDAHGPIDMQSVENALNGSHVSGFDNILGNNICAGDFKWVFSIYAPPRFWESVQTGTINIGPRFMNSQSYYPEMKEGDHYLTYDVDFSDLKTVIEGITEEQYDHIVNNCDSLYREYIKGNGVHDFISSTIKRVAEDG